MAYSDPATASAKGFTYTDSRQTPSVSIALSPLCV